MRTRQTVAVLLIALGMLAAGCGGDDGDNGGNAAEKGPKAAGTGYELTLADGWMDSTKNVQGSVIRFDLLIGKKGGTFNTNVNILREKVGEDIGNDDLRKVYRGQLESVGATSISGTRPASLDGDDAFTYEYDQKAASGETIHGRQVAVVHDGHAHTITLSAQDTKFDSANAEFSQMMGSWRWK